MAYARPTLTSLRDNALETIAAAQIYDLTTGQIVSPVLLQFDPLTIQAKVMAGLAYEEFGYIDYISQQATPFTAVDEIALGWGALISVTQQPATAATGTVTLTASALAPLAIGTQLVRSDGVTYATTVGYSFPPGGGTVTLPFQATTTGAATTITVGATLSLANPLANISPTGTVASALAGTDIETLDAFKTRYLAQYANPPQGGALSDYVNWALAVPGVTRVWPISDAMGPGTVGVYVMLDLANATSAGFPNGTSGISPLDNNSHPRSSTIATGDLLTVANALIPLQPVTAVVWALKPLPLPISFTIANLGSANTAALIPALQAALGSVCVALGDPRGTTIYPSSWNQAIATIAGVTTFTLTSPISPLTIATGYLPTVGTLSVSS